MAHSRRIVTRSGGRYNRFHRDGKESKSKDELYLDEGQCAKPVRGASMGPDCREESVIFF